MAQLGEPTHEKEGLHACVSRNIVEDYKNNNGVFEYQLHHYSKIPDWMRDNPWILKGYRVNLGLKRTILSLFRIHNETGNIWTHLLGSLFFLVLTFAISYERGYVKFDTRMPFPTDSMVDFPYSESNSLCITNTNTLNSSKIASDPDYTRDLFEKLGRAWAGEIKELVPHLELVLMQLKSEFVDSAAISSQALATLRQNTVLAQKRASNAIHSISSGVRSGLDRAFHNLYFLSKYNANSRCFDGGEMENSSKECHGLAAHILHSLQSLHFSLENISRIYKGPHFQNLWGILGQVDQCVRGIHRNVSCSIIRKPVAMLQDLYTSTMKPNAVPLWPLYVYMIGAITCLMISAIAHLLHCHSYQTSVLCWRFDYTGIAIMIAASTIGAVCYMFIQELFVRNIYICVTAVLSGSTVCLSLIERFQAPSYGSLRALVFVLLGLHGTIPVIHFLRITDFAEDPMIFARYEMLMGLLYLAAALFFALQIPERLWPGAFDYWLHGHQIFHLLIVAAAYQHYLAVRHLIAWRESVP